MSFKLFEVMLWEVAIVYLSLKMFTKRRNERTPGISPNELVETATRRINKISSSGMTNFDPVEPFTNFPSAVDRNTISEFSLPSPSNKIFYLTSR